MLRDNPSVSATGNPLHSKKWSEQDQQYDLPKINRDPHYTRDSQLETVNARQPHYQPHQTSIVSKQKLLQRVKYINPIARLEYEDKHTEVYSRVSKLSKETMLKKIRAKNQIADFVDEQQNQGQDYDELIEFKYGKQKSEQYHFEKNELKEFQFCPQCDQIFDDHPQVHLQICQRKQAEEPELYSPYSEDYEQACKGRLQQICSKFKGYEYEQLLYILNYDKRGSSRSGRTLVNLSEKIYELMASHEVDHLFQNIAAKVKQVCRI